MQEEKSYIGFYCPSWMKQYIKADAKKCKTSSTKFIVAILQEFYKIQPKDPPHL